jgi:uncharacterized alpha-E superfamily protein
MLVVLVTAGLTGLGYLLLRFVITPVERLRDTRQAIDRALRHHAGVVAGSPKEIPQAELALANDTFRALHADLTSTSNAIPLYGVLAFLHAVPSRNDVATAVKGLTYLAHTVREEYSDAKWEQVNAIKHALKLPTDI